jgi:hypothetical protein
MVSILGMIFQQDLQVAGIMRHGVPEPLHLFILLLDD